MEKGKTMRPPIYEPKGAAKEYGDLALNIYTGCPHRCYYCFAPGVLHKDREAFHSHVEPRPGIVEEVKKQLEKEKITGKLIHLCFTCDPYPTGYDSTATREIIQLLKDHGNHVQILTKGDGRRDFDLLDSEDWYGITLDCGGPAAIEANRTYSLGEAKRRGIKTWVSFEPVLDAKLCLQYLNFLNADKVKIGKLNYHPSEINWAQFGRDAEALCRRLGLDYYIKDSLRAEMERGNA
jgi:DNA repair photolyase